MYDLIAFVDFSGLHSRVWRQSIIPRGYILWAFPATPLSIIDSKKVSDKILDPGVMKVQRQSKSHLKSPAQASCERFAETIRNQKRNASAKCLITETVVTNNVNSAARLKVQDSAAEARIVPSGRLI